MSYRLRIGSVLRVGRMGLYDHYGIYVGRSSVIHFSEGIIRKDSLRSFAGVAEKKRRKRLLTQLAPVVGIMCELLSDGVSVDVMQFDSSAIADISLRDCAERAKSMLGRSGYDIFDNNCEHFAIWARTGVAESSQAFGSRSKIYAATAASMTFTRLVSKLTGSSVGMSVSHTITVS